MLDTATKRRIDTARDILVGKVPDPKSQVEQITIALIYKFMDDMDAESEEFGGKRKFFAGEFARYGWAKLMRSGLGGFEALNLYAEAITKMPENPGIPLLFREIFKNAYLPYRDPETLRAFLKIIDEFSYDHSERLGDAYEYLLSVLGSQGDAGQFRTPRHIIDFIVKIVDPKKTETVLDPACGTAGFLISSYKHILKANTDAKGSITLTPDEKGRLARNFTGYDISPDMVRLSLVNLYLHGFAAPNIYEYDTLTSQDRWNEHADVILANPPFMSPKGGIKPHKRFSVQSKRSEVLFVDYMAEHLSPIGRAGIIVPEGIIFQSQSAHKNLRKMLVEDYLVAVVSLPTGVFNPYSGVKTSILILDKSLAKQIDTIGFFKVENDGFNLGAQRREIDRNDLPQVCDEIADYLDRLRAHKSLDGFQPTMGLVVLKEKITANGDYNLSGDRYREVVSATSVFPFVPISEVARIKNGFAFKSEEYVENGLRVMRIKNVQKGEVVDDDPKFIAAERQKEFADYTLKAGDILMSLTGNVGRVGQLKPKHEPAILNQRVAHIELINGTQCLSQYLFFILNTEKFEKDAIFGSSGVAQANLSSKWVGAYQIPLPPIEIQKEIAAEIEGYQKVIDGARAVVDNYRSYIPIHPDWPIVELGKFCSFKNGLNFTKASYGHSAKIIGVGDFQNNLYVPLENLKKVNLDMPLADEYLVKGGDIVFVRSNGNPDLVGRSVLVPPPNEPTTFSGFTIRGRIEDERALPLFYAHFFKSRDFAEMIKTVGQGANIRNLSQAILKRLKVPFPPLATQQAIVAEIEAEQTLVNANRELIDRFEKKIQATINRVWGEE